MRIIVVSDSHGSAFKLDLVFLKHPMADIYLHLGDGERDLDTVLSRMPDLRPRAYHVQGNCDFASLSPSVLTLSLEGGHQLLALHGHMHNVYYGTQTVSELARQNGADLILHGHTHCRYAKYEDGLWIMNPGSVSQPRDGQNASYGIIDVTQKGIMLTHADV